MRSLRPSLMLLFLLIFASSSFATPAPPSTPHGYLRYPDLSDARLLFTAGGDLWTAPAEGGAATRLTSHDGMERYGAFSPDGQWIAFSGEYNGNADVYIMPATGGEPRQLTFHPSPESVVGWTEEGQILFRSYRRVPLRSGELYTVDPEGGPVRALPFLRASHLAGEPGGDRVAITRQNLAWDEWNRYRGGQAERIWVGVADPDDPRFDEPLPQFGGNESWPMWSQDGRIVFVMDSLGRENLWAMQPDGSELASLTDYQRFDVRYPRLHKGMIIYQHGADLALTELASGESRPLEITVPTDRVNALRRWVDPLEQLESWSLSENGARLVVGARGELFTAPVKAEGLVRRWTHSSGSREQQPKLLGDGSMLAITDASGEHRIVRYPAPGGSAEGVEAEAIDDWKDLIVPSPDDRWLALATGDQKLWLIDLDKGRRQLIDEGGWEFSEIVWAPDSRTLAYVLTEGEAEKLTLKLYDLASEQKHTLGDPRFNTHSPAWDAQGRYLYCITDRHFGFKQDYNRGLFTFEDPSQLALLRLRSDVPSPSLARGDAAEPGLPGAPWLGTEAEKEEDEEQEVQPIEIEYQGLASRLETLDHPAGNYGDLAAVGTTLYFVDNGEDRSLKAWDLAEGEPQTLLSSVRGYQLSEDGKLLVARKGSSFYWTQGGSTSLKSDEQHTISTDGWEIEIDPAAEWRQILREAWRQQREFFYDPEHHDVDWNEVLARYGPLLDRVATREDLNDLIREIQAEQSAGHSFIAGGEGPDLQNNGAGLLGIDAEPDTEAGYWRITRVLAPEPGTAGGASPLHYADPSAGPGSYILAINGESARAEGNLLSLLRNSAGRSTALLLNEKPILKGAREVLVEPLASEARLRYWDWTKQMRQRVHELSEGRVGYVHLPDMSGSGMREFGRDYYPQRHLPGMILDVRYNTGGNISEYLLKEMTAPIHTLQSSRYGAWQTKPHGAFAGHTALLANEVTFSDGEMMVHAVRTVTDWPVIGQRTSGGGVWLWARRPLLDGGRVIVPEFGSWSAKTGEWVIEGTGVAPTIEVQNSPADEIAGRDPQLTRALEEVLKAIEADPPTLPERPARGPDTTP